MEEPAVMGWNRVIHKGVRTQDGQPVGYIVADDELSLVILAGRFKEYNIPKMRVKAFDGSQVYLDFPISELEQYRMA